MVSSRTHLSIGDVLTLLREEFPDVTISKIRFLESQGLVNPERSPSGYRKFYEHDVERLRWVLRQQREHFLPLKVIRDRLAEGGDRDADEPVTDANTPSAPVHANGDAAAAGVAAHGSAPLSHGSGQPEQNVDAGLPAAAAAADTPEAGTTAAGTTAAGTTAVAASDIDAASPATRAEAAGGPSGGPTGGEPAPATPPSASSAAVSNANPVDAAGSPVAGGDAANPSNATSAPANATSAPANATSSPADGVPGPAAATDAVADTAAAPDPVVAPDSAAVTEPAATDPAPATEDPEPHEAALLREVVRERLPGFTAADDAAATTPGPAATTEPAERAPRARGGSAAGAAASRRAGRGAHAATDDEAAEGANEHGADDRADDATEGNGDDTKVPSSAAGGSGSNPAAGRGRPAGLAANPLEDAATFGMAEDLTGVSLTADELSSAAGLSQDDVATLVSYGLIESTMVAGIDCFDETSLAVATLAAQLSRYGVEPRHLRLYRNAVERESGLIEQIVTPLLRQRNPEARQRAIEAAADLAKLGQSLRGALLRKSLRDLFG